MNHDATAPTSFEINEQLSVINARLINSLNRNVKGQNVVVTTECNNVIHAYQSSFHDWIRGSGHVH
jgi:hypothetical protein